jgi:hypothetical protein
MIQISLCGFLAWSPGCFLLILADLLSPWPDSLGFWVTPHFVGELILLMIGCFQQTKTFLKQKHGIYLGDEDFDLEDEVLDLRDEVSDLKDERSELKDELSDLEDES